MPTPPEPPKNVLLTPGTPGTPGTPAPFDNADIVKQFLTAFATKRPKFSGLWYDGKEVDLDGKTYENCRFDNCKLSIATGDIELIGCLIDDSTKLIIGDPASRIARLINRKLAIDALSNFEPKVVGNRITISPPVAKS